MAEICAGENPLFPLAPLDGEGTPTGIDIRKVVRSSIVPVINTAIAHHTAARMIGAGIATPPRSRSSTRWSRSAPPTR